MAVVHDTKTTLPLQIAGRDADLHIRFSKGERSGDLLLILDEIRHPEPTAKPIAQFSLTPRECDVLNWLAKGKTNRDIADIIGISSRTVNKHLEHIFVKLGVETRSAAVALAVGIRRSESETA